MSDEKKTGQYVLKRTKEKLRTIPSEISLKKYLNDDKTMLLENIQKEELHLACSSYSKKQDYIKNKQSFKIKVHERYKIKKIDLQKRLFIKSPSQAICAVTDLDENFYNCINGRSVKDKVPTHKSLKFINNNLLRIKQEIGYRHDSILSIKTNYENELVIFNTSVVRCMQQAKYLDEFILEDYRKSMAFLVKWDKLKIKLEEKMSELYNVANEQFTIMSRLMALDCLYNLQQKYGRFLYYLSPPNWRSKNREFARSFEIKAKGFDLGQCSEEDSFNVAFEKMRNECIGNFIKKPVLYFTHPRDLIIIFEGIEKQQLRHFFYVTHLAPRKKILKEGIKSLKDIVSQETSSVASTIRGFEKLLEFTDERCNQLKNRFFTILDGLFYTSVGAPEVLKLFVNLEFCYEKVFAEKPTNMDIVTMAKSLEGFYMDYTKRLDYIHNGDVKRAVFQCIREEHKKMEKAKYATRELRLFDRLEKELHRAYQPIGNKIKSFKKPVKKLINYKPPINGDLSESKLNIAQKEPLKDSEIEYLTLFTDWVEGENPNQYFHRVDESK